MSWKLEKKKRNLLPTKGSQEYPHVVGFRKTKRICRDEEKEKRATLRTIILYFWYLLSEKQYGHDAKFIDHLLHVRRYKNDQYSLKELIIHRLGAGSGTGR